MPRRDEPGNPKDQQPDTPLTSEYHPTIVASEKPATEQVDTMQPLEGWRRNSELVTELRVKRQTVKHIADRYRLEHPEWFKIYWIPGGKQEFYHPDLVALITKEILESKPLEGWKNNNALAKELNADFDTVERIAEKHRPTHPEWFKMYRIKGGMREHYHPDLVTLITKECLELKPPEGWQTIGSLAEQFGMSDATIKRMANKYRSTHPEWFKKYRGHAGISEHLHPDLITLINKEILESTIPEGWKSIGKLVEELDVSGDLIKRIAEKHRLEHPEWFKKYRGPRGISNYYHPELVDIIRDAVAKLLKSRAEQEEERRRQAAFEDFVKEAAEGETPIAKELQKLIAIFGTSRTRDVLSKFRPEFRGLPTEYVDGIVADYLGDFLVVPGEFHPNDLEKALPLLSELTLREGLFETIKDHCLDFYFKQRRENPNQSSFDIIYGYLDHIVDQIKHIQSKELDDIIQGVVKYYDSVLRDFHKPEQFVDTLSRNREFPDINQRINMKELMDKKQLLIADEMGLGKSASVIMAKEQLGVRCALVVAPSNVLTTWQQYLSEEPEGYFKTGTGPRVLFVDDPEALNGITADSYDYILISQERMNERYTAALQRIDFGMTIIDEVHKLKTLEGERTGELVDLMEKIGGPEKYLTLLSGTPAPNKVEDIAIVLKLLYPEKFKEMSSRELIQQIIDGDLVNLRADLLPRMQMKSLEQGVEMPQLTESIIETELTGLEKDVYEVLLEDDEVLAHQKIMLLRQFLLNPALVDSTPNLESTKIRATGEAIRTALTAHDKVILFVNDYIEDVIRGEDSILSQFGLLPDVEVRIIHGENPEERPDIQHEFQNSPSKKILLVVSGQTADVGVDFSAAGAVFFYNEPWTEYQRRQELARAYRPGLQHPLESKTFIARGTIEEGIHEYIGRKYLAIEKLLRGIPLQELEKQMLKKDEKADPKLEVDPELAEYYFSAWDRLMKIFGYVKEIGEEDFKKFLTKHGKDYADAYVDLGNRSYQSNGNRVTGTLITKMAEERGASPETLRILDVASGPELLRQHIGDAYQDRVTSFDINHHHFKTDSGGKRAVASWLDTPFQEKSFDYVHLSFALPYSKFLPSKNNFERVELLLEMNRLLKPGGRAVINLIYSFEIRDPEKLGPMVEPMGFKVVDEYSGEVEAEKHYRSRVITLEKVTDVSTPAENVMEKVSADTYPGLKFRKTDDKIKDQRKIVEEFGLNGRQYKIQFNEQDTRLLAEERAVLQEGEQLKQEYGKIADIPRHVVIAHQFVRILVGKKYVLFKRLKHGAGVVIVK